MCLCFGRAPPQSEIDRPDEKSIRRQSDGASHEPLPERRLCNPERTDVPHVGHAVSPFWPQHWQTSPGTKNRLVTDSVRRFLRFTSFVFYGSKRTPRILIQTVHKFPSWLPSNLKRPSGKLDVWNSHNHMLFPNGRKFCFMLISHTGNLAARVCL